ncbi:MAG: mannose-1-phosphate guanylyltransferase, partial [Oligoflexia bacterium]|nr:mannose-1-phosphate guanylyltransferase [Oligoflexia bacterium]
MKRFAIIMAGGSGTRFWPKSTRANPKQFLSLAGANSLIQQTSLRIKNLVPPKNQFVVTTESLRKLTRKHLPKATLLCEPEGRNTLAAIAWSAWTVEETSPGATMIVLPSDAFIQNENAYREVIGQSCEIAESLNMIVCVGIKPNYPATGYGYIQAGENLRSGVSRIMRFVEKPGPEKAEQFINEGTYCWNAGIFIAKSSTIIDEVRRVQPAVAAIMDQIIKKPRMLKSLYKKVPKLPFDIAIMERT